MVLFKKKDKKKKKKSVLREWLDAIIFAVIAATIIRWGFVEAFTIPTPSMEQSLLVGDYLFVSKIHYGSRTPKTPLQVPLTHQSISIGNLQIPTYLDWIQLPSVRLPGISTVKNDDVVVFNYPGDTLFPTDLRTNYIKRCIAIPGDTLLIEEGSVMINGKKRTPEPGQQATYVINIREAKDKLFEKLNVSPLYQLDKANYTIILPDSLKNIISRQNFVYAFTQITPSQANAQVDSLLATDTTLAVYKMETFINQTIDQYLERKKVNIINKSTFVTYGLTTTEDIIEKIRKYDFIISAKRLLSVDPEITKRRPSSDKLVYDYIPADIYPNGEMGWTLDEFGPLYVPGRGDKIELTQENIKKYGDIIRLYEGHDDVKVHEGQVFINGEHVTEYTFEQNYYFMMGDNRHNSQDSRFWGFVPHDHVIGKAQFVWFSVESGSLGSFFSRIRWSRIGYIIE